MSTTNHALDLINLFDFIAFSVNWFKITYDLGLNTKKQIITATTERNMNRYIEYVTIGTGKVGEILHVICIYFYINNIMNIG